MLDHVGMLHVAEVATAGVVPLIAMAAVIAVVKLRKVDAPPPPDPPVPMPAPEALDPIAVTALVTHAPPMTINPTSEQEVSFAAYRADAIARDCEQRKAEGREQHPEYAVMRAEAMTYAWMLVRSGRWTEDHVRQLSERLKWQ